VALVADIHHVSINVADTARAVAFYVDVLGLQVLPRPTMRVSGAWLAAGASRQIHLIEAPVPPDNGQHFAFLVDDLDAAVGALRDAGVEVRGPIEIAGTGARQAFFADPDGNRLEFNQPAPG
jgi:catechol 2,3-dioxygenase-like lactoylglutathione lyase family enzyme